MPVCFSIKSFLTRLLVSFTGAYIPLIFIFQKHGRLRLHRCT